MQRAKHVCVKSNGYKWRDGGGGDIVCETVKTDACVA